MGRRNPLLQGLLTGLSIGFCRLTAALPLPAARMLGTGLARLAYYAVPRIRRVGMANLDLAYGETLAPAEKTAILKESVRNLGLVAAEFGRTPRLVAGEMNRWFRVRGADNIDRTRGAVFMGAHLGNWEWLAPAGGTAGFNTVIIVRGFDDPRMDRAVDAIRQSERVKTLDKNSATGPMMGMLRNGWAAGVLADQNPRENAVPVRFFGAPTWATIGPVLIARRGKVPIYPVSMVRDTAGVYTLEFRPALELSATGDFLADLAENTQRCQNAIEAMVRENPGQWLWFHRRWRSRGRLEREWEERRARHSEKGGADGDNAGVSAGDSSC